MTEHKEVEPTKIDMFEDWLIRNMPAGTVIGEPTWWAKKIRNVLSYEKLEPNAITIPTAEYEQLKSDAERLHWIDDEVEKSGTVSFEKYSNGISLYSASTEIMQDMPNVREAIDQARNKV